MMVAVCVTGAYTTHELHFCTSSWSEKKRLKKIHRTLRAGGRELERLCVQAPQGIEQHALNYTVSHMAHTHTHRTGNMAHHIVPLSLGLKERHATRLLRWVAWFIRGYLNMPTVKETAFLCTLLEVRQLAYVTKGHSMQVNCTACWRSSDKGFKRRKKSFNPLLHGWPGNSNSFFYSHTMPCPLECTQQRLWALSGVSSITTYNEAVYLALWEENGNTCRGQQTRRSLLPYSTTCTQQ